MEKVNVIAVDLGASSGRIILSTLTPDKCTIEELYRFPNTFTRLFGRLYWNIYELFTHVLTGLARAAERGIRIDSIGIDTWGVDMVYVGRDGSILGLPRAYRDPYTNGITKEFFRIISRREVYQRTGIQVMEFNSLYQLYAAQRERNSALDAAEHILFIPDALSYLLTGNMVCEHTILSTSQLMDPYSGEIDPVLLQAAGIRPEMFPPRVMPGHVIGTLTPEVAAATRLRSVPVVAVAGHDTASAVAAIPATDNEFAYLSSGTWSLMGIETTKPIINSESFSMNFTNEGGMDGTVRFLKNITGMWLLEECRRVWRAAGRDYSYEQVVEMTSAAPSFGSLIDPDDPRFGAPEDMVSAIRGYCRYTAQPEPQNDASIIRCILESLALKYRTVLDKLRQVSPHPIRTLHVIGGGAQNDLLNAMTASATGIPVIAGPVEATAIGNIMVQAKAAGMVEDLAHMRRYIASSFETRRFEPSGTGSWNEALVRFETIIQTKR